MSHGRHRGYDILGVLCTSSGGSYFGPPFRGALSLPALKESAIEYLPSHALDILKIAKKLDKEI